MIRAEKIKEARLRQPVEELERKAKKSIQRANLWTQEEFDLTHARARKLAAAIKWI